MKRLFRVGFWKYAVAFLAPMIFVMLVNPALDNDSWGVLAQGKQILESGLYHEDMLSMHTWLPVVLPNYAFSVVFYLIYTSLGAAGIYAVMLVLNFVVMILLYKICMLLSNKNVNLSLILTMITDIVLAFGFIVTRVQMVDYVVLLVLIYGLELFIKTDKTRYLWVVPIVSLILANFHASMWWMIFAIMGAYIVDAIRLPKLQGYRIWPLLIMSVAAIAAGLFNPYGYEMLLSIFTSYGGLKELDIVKELMAFEPIKDYIFYISIMIVITLYAFGNGKNVRARFLLLFFGFLAIGITSVKGMSELILVMFFPLALVYKNWKWKKLINDSKIRRMAIACTGALTILMSVAAITCMLVEIENRPNKSIGEVMDMIDMEVGEKNKEDLKVYVGYNYGGYVEFRGYPAYLDPRGAEFTKRMNGKEDILQEWRDVTEGRITVGDFVGKYDFDYLILDGVTDGKMYEADYEEYDEIYENENDEVKVLRRIRI